ncbi:MAG: hypothetical protein K2J62_00005, partial [Bacteroidales bacterium]|nr:hypothetical protein [Bacteroidales bacterium]
MEKLKAIFKAAGRVLKDALLHSGYGTPLNLGQGTQYKARTVVTLIDPLISQVHPEQQNRAEHVETKEFCPRKRLFPWTRGRDLSVSATNRLHCVVLLQFCCNIILAVWYIFIQSSLSDA